MAASPDGPAYIEADATFTIIPEWVLDAEVSDRAVRLYGALRRYADLPQGAIPSRATLAKRLRCSVDSVDRAAHELVGIGAVLVMRRRDAAGDWTSNRYALRSTPGVAAPVRPPSRTPAATGSRTGAAQKESDLKEIPLTPTASGGGTEVLDSNTIGASASDLEHNGQHNRCRACGTTQRQVQVTTERSAHYDAIQVRKEAQIRRRADEARALRDAERTAATGAAAVRAAMKKEQSA